MGGGTNIDDSLGLHDGRIMCVATLLGITGDPTRTECR